MTFFEHMQQVLHTYSTHAESHAPFVHHVDKSDPAPILFHFEDGIPGFREDNTFELRAHPTWPGCFYVESQNNAHVRFLALPIDPHKGPIDKEDLIEGARALKSRFEDCAFLSLLSIRAQEDQGSLLTMNLKAPLILDMVSRQGKQVVLNGDYPLDHLLMAIEG